MTSASRAPPFSHLTTIRNNHHRHHKPPLNSRHLHIRPIFPSLSTSSTSTTRLTPTAAMRSGVDGGAGDFVSTNSFYHEFSLIANMLKKIEPLDTSVISNGVSDSVKHSMKEMISTMLGLLPSDQFAVTVTVSKRPLVRLLASSLITGYTLWNAEYRIKLMRNFESLTVDMMPNRLNSGDCNDGLDGQIDENGNENENENEDVNVCDHNGEELERQNHEICLDDLSPDALSYIRKLESEVSTTKKDLHIQKKETIRIGHARENSNDLLKYLRSLDLDMMNELSRPSSSEVKEVLQQLVRRTSQRIFKEDITPDLMRDSKVVQETYQTGSVIFTETRDYLAKLLFWCMLLGHQLRSLENRLYLSCAVGY